MSKPILFSLTQTPEAPVFCSLYEDMGYEVMQFTTVRKAIGALRKHKPKVVIAQFLYAYSNNYASNHISNLDTLLITLQTLPGKKPDVIFLCYKEEIGYLEELTEHYAGCCSTNHALTIPVNKDDMEATLKTHIICSSSNLI